jgi:hypothetical protein
MLGVMDKLTGGMLTDLENNLKEGLDKKEVPKTLEDFIKEFKATGGKLH